MELERRNFPLRVYWIGAALLWIYVCACYIVSRCLRGNEDGLEFIIEDFSRCLVCDWFEEILLDLRRCNRSSLFMITFPQRVANEGFLLCVLEEFLALRAGNSRWMHCCLRRWWVVGMAMQRRVWSFEKLKLHSMSSLKAVNLHKKLTARYEGGVGGIWMRDFFPELEDLLCSFLELIRCWKALLLTLWIMTNRHCSFTRGSLFQLHGTL